MSTPCAQRVLVDRHFAGRNRPATEQALRAHLSECSACRKHYERHLLLASADPRALSAEQRLAIGLGLGPRRSGARPFIAFGAAVMVAGLAGVIFVPMLRTRSQHPETSSSGFVARGQPTAEATSLLVYVATHDGPLEAQQVLRPNDELAFAYRNAAGKRYLFVFAVSQARRTYWYHPAWTDAQKDPVAIALSPSPDLVELKEAVRHDLPRGDLYVYGVFMDRALRVREVERLVARTPAGQSLPIDGAIQRVLKLHVRADKGRGP